MREEQIIELLKQYSRANMLLARERGERARQVYEKRKKIEKELSTLIGYRLRLIY